MMNKSKRALVTLARLFQNTLFVFAVVLVYAGALAAPGTIAYGFSHRVDVALAVTAVWWAFVASLIIRELWDSTSGL
jgi:hypothetical protein